MITDEMIDTLSEEEIKDYLADYDTILNPPEFEYEP